MKLEDLRTIIYCCFILHNFCELEGCGLSQEYVDHQMRVNIANRCCPHHEKPDTVHTYSNRCLSFHQINMKI